MELTQKETSFLTLMNETRLTGSKMFKRDSDIFRKVFSFSDEELIAAVNKLVKAGFLTAMDLGSDELIYFHTKKVSPEILDERFSSIRR